MTPTMSIDTFLERLAALGMKWHLSRFGEIRSGLPGCAHCPISAVTGNQRDFMMPASAAVSVLLMNADDALDIVYAADLQNHRTRVLRSRLLKACGLEAE